jgi:hypothetical protein
VQRPQDGRFDLGTRQKARQRGPEAVTTTEERTMTTEKDPGTKLVERLLRIIERDRHKLEPPKLLLYVLGCVVANAVDADTRERELADAAEVAGAAKLAIEHAWDDEAAPKPKDDATRRARGFASPQDRDHAMVVISEQIVYTDTIFDAMLGTLEKLAADTPADPPTATFALARVIGHFMAFDAALPTGEFEEIAYGLGRLAASQARHLREQNGGQPLQSLGRLQ